MANSAQARKRAKQNETRRLRNQAQKSMMRTHIKGVLKAIESGDKERADKEFLVTQSIIDRVADKDIIHKNKAARLKSRLSAKLKQLAAPAQ